jgi:hypothetical protein
VDIGTVANQRIKQRPAGFAVRVVAGVIPEDQKIVVAPGEPELAAFDASDRLERRAGCATAVRTMAIHRIKEFINHRILDRATQTLSGQRAGA